MFFFINVLWLSMSSLSCLNLFLNILLGFDVNAIIFLISLTDIVFVYCIEIVYVDFFIFAIL